MKQRWLDDSGAALVTVLMIVAVMAAAAAITFEALGYSVKLSTARRMYDQARLYALGGEQLALVATAEISKAKSGMTEPRAVSYPIDGGQIDALITDKSNCFNVNSLVDRGDSGALSRREYAANQYQRLLVNLGFAKRQAAELSATLVDWIDTDTRPVNLGAEDYDYTSLSPSYRAANTFVADITELSVVKGYTPEVLAQVKPYVCVGYSSELVRLNVNSLTERDAPMLAAIVGDIISVDKALDIIIARPSGGYDDVADFWAVRGFRGLTIPQEVRQQTTVKAYLFESRIRIRFHDAVTHMTSMIYVDDAAVGQTLERRFGILN